MFQTTLGASRTVIPDLTRNEKIREYEGINRGLVLELRYIYIFDILSITIRSLIVQWLVVLTYIYNASGFKPESLLLIGFYL